MGLRRLGKSLKKIVKFERENLRHIGGGIKDDPSRLLKGALDPFGSKLWGYDKGLVNQLGGATNEAYARAEAKGIDTGPGKAMHDIAGAIATFYAGGYGASKLGALRGGAGSAVLDSSGVAIHGTAPAAGGGLLSKIGTGTLLRGAALGGSQMMSGKGGGDDGGSAGSIQEQLAAALAEQTDPLRRMLLGRSERVVGGDLGASPVFSAMKNQAEGQYNVAKSNIIGSTPAGGALTAALAGLEGDRADTLTQGAGAVYDTEIARALGLATGQTGQAMTGLSSAASLQAAQAQAEADREGAMLGALGTGVGAWLGSKD